MADSDNTTSLPFVIGQQGRKRNAPAGAEMDPALSLWGGWHQARYVSLLLCRVRQRLEARIMANTGIQVLTSDKSVSRRMQGATPGPRAEYEVACEAEVFAMTEELRFQDLSPASQLCRLLGLSRSWK